jgi:hypothetical protein
LQQGLPYSLFRAAETAFPDPQVNKGILFGSEFDLHSPRVGRERFGVNAD